MCAEHVSAENVCAPTLCVCVLLGEPLAREELAQAWVSGLFLRKPGLRVTP